MQFEVKNRWTGDVQFTAEIDADENTSLSVKIGLAVRWAYQSDANLRDANLSDAYLRGAKGINPYICTPSLGRFDQSGKQRAYKLVGKNGEGIYQGGLKYEIGKTVSVDDANTDPSVRCAAGINVAEIDWVCREWFDGHRILLVEFSAKDIACIPTATDGKFRLHRCKVLREVSLIDLGLVNAHEQAA